MCVLKTYFTFSHLFQVCEAGLHISLGVGLRLFKLLEHDLQLLDSEMSVQTEEEERTAVQQQLVCLLKNAQAWKMSRTH